MAISSGLGVAGTKPGICTSATRPSSPYEGQMIYETDTDLVYLWNGSAWVEVISALTKAPRGVVAFRSRGTSTGALSVSTVTISSVSFTAVANRNYRITYYEPQSLPGGASTFAQIEILNGTTTSGTLLQSCSLPQISGARAAGTNTYIGTFSAGTVNIVATAYPNGGTVNFVAQSNNFAFLMVEDIGAV